MFNNSNKHKNYKYFNNKDAFHPYKIFNKSWYKIKSDFLLYKKFRNHMYNIYHLKYLIKETLHLLYSNRKIYKIKEVYHLLFKIHKI